MTLSDGRTGPLRIGDRVQVFNLGPGSVGTILAWVDSNRVRVRWDAEQPIDRGANAPDEGEPMIELLRRVDA